MPSTKARPWIAEREVSPELVRALLAAQMPKLRAGSIEPLGAGWDNTAYLVDGTWVFRFPRRQVAVALMGAEIRLLPRIAAALPLPVPVPEWVGAPDERFPWPFAGYRLLAGTPAYRVPAAARPDAGAAAKLGEFLAALHGLPLVALELPGDSFDRAGIAARKVQVMERYQRLGAEGVLPDPSRWLAVLDRLGSPAPGPRRAAVHGDFDVRHILAGEDGRPCGVIDWGDLHQGDPAMDLTVALAYLPPALRPAFFAAYGPVDAAALDLARLRALHSVSCCLEYAHAIGDEPMVEAYRRGLENLLE